MNDHLIVIGALVAAALLMLTAAINDIVSLHQLERTAADCTDLYRSYGKNALFTAVLGSVATILTFKWWPSNWWLILPSIIIFRLIVAIIAKTVGYYLKNKR